MPTIAVANAATKTEISDVSRGKGIITVSGATAQTRYACNANGSTDDRATVLSAMAAAVADMPATVTIGPGDYSMSGGMHIEPAQGEKGLTIRGAGANSTRFIFDKGSALAAGEFIMFRVRPAVTPTVGVYATYLQDIHIDGIGVYDNDPATHDSGAEESHGFSIAHTVNGNITNCVVDNVGDEGINLSNVYGGKVTGNYTVSTPSLSSSGAINIALGCNSVVVAHNKVVGGAAPGTRSTVSGTNGITVEIINSALASDIVGVTISDNMISGPENAGVSISISDSTNDSDVVGLKVENNFITDTLYGVSRIGEGGIAKAWSISMNTITDVDSSGISFNTISTATVNCSMSFNTIENITVASENGIYANGTGINMSGNNIKNVDNIAIYSFSGEDIVISGGNIDGCGDTTTATIEGNTSATSILVDGVNITNSASTTYAIRRVTEVKNCNIHQTTPSQFQILGVKRVIGNTMNGAIQSDGDGFIISNNNIDSSAVDTGNDSIKVSADSNGVISGNRIINTGGNRIGIDLEDGSTNNIVDGNWLDVTIGIRLQQNSDDNIINNNYIDGSTTGLSIESGATGITMLGNNCVSAGTDAQAYFADGHHPADKTEWEKYNFGTITALT